MIAFQSLLLAGIHPQELFDEQICKEYEFTMRKLILLKSLAETATPLLDGLALPARSRNLSRALRTVLQSSPD